jgi:hypothetical protein
MVDCFSFHNYNVIQISHLMHVVSSSNLTLTDKFIPVSVGRVLSSVTSDKLRIQDMTTSFQFVSNSLFTSILPFDIIWWREYLEDRGSRFLQTVGKCLPDFTVSYPKNFHAFNYYIICDKRLKHRVHANVRYMTGEVSYKQRKLHDKKICDAFVDMI